MQYNDKYESELRQLIANNPKNFIRMIKSKGFKGRCPDRTHLVNYIYECTPMLDDSIHTFKTRLYWTLNHIQDFPICANTIDGQHRMHDANVVSLDDGYRKYCCSKCQHSDPNYVKSIHQAINDKYGVDNAFQIQSVKDDLAARQTEIQKKRDYTRKQNFGDSAGWNLDKSIQTRREKYGSAWNLAAIAQTKLEKYGSSNWNNSDKAFQTKRLRGNLNTSHTEDVIIEVMRTKMPNAIRQYKSDKYPFSCDVYDPDSDTYFEYQGSWTHGGKPFDETDDADVQKLNEWKSKDSQYYENAIQTWTVRDPLKRNTAATNGLNFVEFWTYDDVERYLNLDFAISDWLNYDCTLDVMMTECDRIMKICETSDIDQLLQSRWTSSLIIKYFQQSSLYANEKLFWINCANKSALVSDIAAKVGKSIKLLTDLDILDGIRRLGKTKQMTHVNPKWLAWFVRKYDVKTCFNPMCTYGHDILGSSHLEQYVCKFDDRLCRENANKMLTKLKIKNVMTCDKFDGSCQAMFAYFDPDEYDKQYVESMLANYYDQFKLMCIITSPKNMTNIKYDEVFDVRSSKVKIFIVNQSRKDNNI